MESEPGNIAGLRQIGRVHYRVTVLAIERRAWLTVQGMEAIDSTPVIDIKPLLEWESNCLDGRG